MKVCELIEALNLIGTVYRTKDESRPANQVASLLNFLKGGEGKELTEWLKDKHLDTKTKKPRAIVNKDNLAVFRRKLESSETQAELSKNINHEKLSANEWKFLAKQVSGITARSGKSAAEIIEKHFSDELLIRERVQSVKTQFN